MSDKLFVFKQAGACFCTLGLAFQAIPNPATNIIFKSLAPSPTATASSGSILCFLAMSNNNSAFFSQFTIGPTVVPFKRLESSIPKVLAKA